MNVHPDKKSSPTVALNTTLARMLGLMLSAFGVLSAELAAEQRG